jgi:hypothetical protein
MAEFGFYTLRKIPKKMLLLKETAREQDIDYFLYFPLFMKAQ